MPGEIIKKFKLSKGHLEKKFTDIFRTDSIVNGINLVSRSTFALTINQLNDGLNPSEYPYTYAFENFLISDPQICSDENLSITDCVEDGGTLETNTDLGEQRSGGQVGSSFVVGGMDNSPKNMFDGNRSTFFRMSSAVFPYVNPQLVINLGRRIKPRKLTITFNTGTNQTNIGDTITQQPTQQNLASTQVFFTNNLNSTTATGDPTSFHQITGADNIVSSLDSGDDGTFNFLSDYSITTSSTNHDIYKQLILDENFFSNKNCDDKQFLVLQFANFNDVTTYQNNDINQSPGTPQGDEYYIDISQIELYEEVDIRDFDAEFDDALLDLEGWKNPRYYGSKLKAFKINEYNDKVLGQPQSIGTATIGENGSFSVGNFQATIWDGDENVFGLKPTVSNKTTALYYSTTLIGGTEDSQFATLKGHSYIGIDKILNINKVNKSITITDRDAEGVADSNEFEGFHRQLTTDFPTGGSFNIKILEAGIPTALKESYFCKMNKGWLIKSFRFNYVPGGELVDKNTMYLYSGSILEEDKFTYQPDSGFTTLNPNAPDDKHPVGTRFRYANNWAQYYYPSNVVDTDGESVIAGPDGGVHNLLSSGPGFASSSIIENEFTSQYYSGSFGFITHHDPDNTFTNAENYARSGLGSASRFIGIDTLNYLNNNYPETELHITFIEGTKDFASGSNDERSMGTFEVNPNIGILDTGSAFNAGLPKRHEFELKGGKDGRFIPKLQTVIDDFLHSHVELQPDGSEPPVSTFVGAGLGLTFASIDVTNDAEIYIQGGINGQAGNINLQTNNPIDITPDQSYSGSLNYELSFLKKDHIVIADIDKTTELMDGIGHKGLLLIPEHLDQEIKNNLDFYIQKVSSLLGLGGTVDDSITYIPYDD